MKKLRERVDEDGIHSDDYEREGRFSPATNLYQPTKPDQHQENPPDAVEDERGRAELLDHGNPLLQNESNRERQYRETCHDAKLHKLGTGRHEKTPYPNTG